MNTQTQIIKQFALLYIVSLYLVGREKPIQSKIKAIQESY